MRHLLTIKHGGINMEANVAFTIFAPDSLLRFYMFATYLPKADLCKSIFCPVGAEKLPHPKLHLRKIPVKIYLIA